MKKNSNEYKHLPLKIVFFSILFGIFFIFGRTLWVLADWYKKTYTMTFDELMFTIMSPLKGTGKGTIDRIFEIVIPTLKSSLIIFTIFAVAFSFRGRIFKYLRRIGALFCSCVLIVSLVFSAQAVKLPDYLKKRKSQTYLYEEYYVNPNDVVISSNGKTNNLIYIYLESMENTYASTSEGGAQGDNNYIPYLTDLAKQGISFTENSNGLLGGFHAPNGTGWTMAALLATTAGIPFSFPLGAKPNDISEHENVAAGVTSLGNILAEKGYRQVFLCGSDSVFGGRREYFESHGNYEIRDYYTAIEKGYIAEDYYVWWGHEDSILYEIAKDELTELANGDQPFNFTMLTVDTHPLDGYVCDICSDEYEGQLEKVLYCADAQLNEFVKWCQAQDFYENTTIIITGDHPRMDTTYVSETPLYDRMVYNCFLNTVATPKGATAGRIFTSFDIFPTILAAIGFEIEGEQLGLGVNMFSGEPTLAELLGYDYLNAEVNKYSEYYLLHFA